MNPKAMISHNERLAVEKIRAAYKAGDMAGALDLVKLTMGIDDLGKAYNKVMGICFDMVEVALIDK